MKMAKKKLDIIVFITPMQSMEFLHWKVENLCKLLSSWKVNSCSKSSSARQWKLIHIVWFYFYPRCKDKCGKTNYVLLFKVYMISWALNETHVT